MGDLDLYKFVNDNNVEYHYYYSKKLEKDQLYIFIDIKYNLADFNKMLGYVFFDDEGIEVTLKQDYACFDGNYLCEYFDIDMGKVFPNLDEPQIVIS